MTTPTLSKAWLDLNPALGPLGEEAIYAAIQRDGSSVLPSVERIFRAFQMVSPAQCRVVLVGLDPYPTPGHAMGLSFSVPYGVNWAKTLRNIAKEYESDLGFPLSTSDLTQWAERGVLLANMALTVRAGEAKSHLDLWSNFTRAWVQSLADFPTSRVWLLWGNDAKTILPLVEAGSARQRILTAPHPSPLAAYRGFFGSRPFSRANEALASLGEAPVDWSLEVQPQLF